MTTIKNGKYAGRSVKSLSKKEYKDYIKERDEYRKKQRHDYYIKVKRKYEWNKNYKPTGTNTKKLYMKVTNDDLELPLSIPCTCEELQRVLGMTRNEVRGRVRSGNKVGRVTNRETWKIVSINLDDDLRKEIANNEF